MDWSPPGSSVHVISEARILERVAISFSRGSSRPRDWTSVSCGRWILTTALPGKLREQVVSWSIKGNSLSYCFFVSCIYKQHIICFLIYFPGGSDGKESSCQYRRHQFDPWVRKIPWRREWQPTPVFLPGESPGQRSLVGYSQWGHKESDTTEQYNSNLFTGERWHLMDMVQPIYFPPLQEEKVRPTVPLLLLNTVCLFSILSCKITDLWCKVTHIHSGSHPFCSLTMKFHLLFMPHFLYPLEFKIRVMIVIPIF